ncbi:aminotransferase class I/II-fold pyridoxal phosphate-dependent enzyme [Vibrio spartinae]|uniref:Aminotransferase n=1 Tax=Vibrio spartinae TaxID=1918945 RepID=A0ABX6R420_9VIBR|nr:aminotransferase class I/II-fold pyridoxal phosphate-dependent enzyme [Vibrio spartinae]QMV16148.1 Putative phenylalanine aminotransferase [Vibrio spartinae]
MIHKLGVDSYDINFSGEDGAGLSLTWTSDEQNLLDIDLNKLLVSRLLAEAQKGAPLLRKYAVNDPYGADAMLQATTQLLEVDFSPKQIICAAGVIGLLNALAGLADDGFCHLNNVYRDLPAWSRNRGFAVTSASSLRTSIDQQWRLLLLEHPSFLETEEELDDFLADACAIAGRRNGIVLIDESNANYLPPKKSLAWRVNQLDNLVVMRGFSKAYGLGALRLGVAICSRNITTKLHSVIPPLAVSPISLDLGSAVWSKGDIMTRLRNQISKEKYAMKQLLDQAGINDRIAEHPLLPYILLPADAPSIQTLASAGILGKLHFTAGTKDENHYYRLSVPLHPKRVQHFRELMKAIKLSC